MTSTDPGTDKPARLDLDEILGDGWQPADLTTPRHLVNAVNRAADLIGAATRATGQDAGTPCPVVPDVETLHAVLVGLRKVTGRVAQLADQLNSRACRLQADDTLTHERRGHGQHVINAISATADRLLDVSGHAEDATTALTTALAASEELRHSPNAPTGANH